MDPSQVKIFSKVDAPRLRYIAEIILGDILGLSWDVVTDRRKLGKHPVINYSTENIKGAFRIIPDTLLFETGLNRRDITISEWNNLPVFFQSAPETDIPFDIFSASFYLVSRYEEYFDFQPDEYGRFKASSSLAYKHGFLGIPVIDLWTKEFSKSFLKKFPTLTFKRNEFKSLLTIDSDQPFAYLGRNLLRSFSGLIHDLTAKSGHAGDRLKVVRHEMKDPYEVYDYIIENIEKFNPDVKFFFPVGDTSKYDKNPSWKNDEYRELIKKITGKYNIGLHPSFYASDNHSLIEEQRSRLKNITGKEISLSRFHFVRLFTPASYRNLIKAGIREDYSMGYPDEPGFRAGIARPYLFYDVPEDRLTDLKIVPFQVMDGTLFQYKNLSPASSGEVMLKIIGETRKAGGLFVSIWHNTSLLETSEWKSWRELFELMLKIQQS